MPLRPIALVTGYELPDTLRGTILEDIVESRLREIIGAKEKLPAVAIERVLDRAPEIRSFMRALARRRPAVVAEIKRASPSAGVIRAKLDAVAIAAEYERAGAAAISVVTEVHHFGGTLEMLAQIRWQCGLPLLRKDFVLDSYQLLEARHAGADAVLLLAVLHSERELRKLRELGERLGMDVLVEVHTEDELERALGCGARLVGVNNRDLRTFEVSLDTSLRLAAGIPKDVVAIAESGIRSASDIQRLEEAGYRGFLIGEQLMRAPSPGEALSALVAHARVGGVRR